MRFLIDTNVLIPLEPTRPEDLEPDTPAAAELVRLAQETGHTVLIHPSALVDLQRDANDARRIARDVLVQKYARLASPPALSVVEASLGAASPGSNDWVDHSLIAAIAADAVHALVTQDGRIHRKAARLGIEDRVFTVDDAITFLRTLHDEAPLTPPAVEFVPVHSMDATDPIFDALRQDYAPDFDGWLTKAKREGRHGWVIRSPDGACAAVGIIKQHDDEFALGGKVLKLSTFKVAPEHQGNRYGELLLKALFGYCHGNAYDHVFVTVFEKHADLIGLFEEFGFSCRVGRRSALGELVFAKPFTYETADLEAMEPLDFHVRFGPPSLKIVEGRVFVVPIEPMYHRVLFPDGEAQTQLVLPRPYGNALRKAYLCRAPIRQLVAGDTLLFYRSHDLRAVTAVGVVEETFVSDDPNQILSVVGQRTVYSLEEIRHLAQRDVLAILFRQDRLLDRPIPEDELIDHGAIRRAPQTIASVRTEATPWLAERIGESSFSRSDRDSLSQSSTA